MVFEFFLDGGALMEINLSPDELEILNWLHVKVKGFGENYLLKASELLAATDIAPDNYEKALSYLKAYQLIATGTVGPVPRRRQASSFGLWRTPGPACALPEPLSHRIIVLTGISLN